MILSNDSLGDDNLNGDTFIWNEINIFEEIYLIRGSALIPADLERARAGKAKAIIILSKSFESTGSGTQNNLDADAIFMYKTIEGHHKNVTIVTELTSVSAIGFLEAGKEEQSLKEDYYSSKPFAAGQIFVSHLLDSLMCQAFYQDKITDLLEQIIMGPANTPQSVMKYYKQLSLSKCSLNLIEIPRGVPMVFQDIFEHCVKNNMIPIGVYKRQDEQTTSTMKFANNQQENKSEALGGRSDEKTQRKSYVWMHPPKKIELNIYD